MIYSAAEKSLFLNLLRKIYGAYCFLEEKVFFWYNQSRTRGILTGIAQCLAAVLRFSFLGRLAAVKEKSAVLENSSVVRFVMRFAAACRGKTVFYFCRSRLADFSLRISAGLSASIFNAGGLILITAVLTDIVLCVFFKKNVRPSGWFVLGSFMFLGLWGMSCCATWDEVKNTSLFLRWRSGKR